MGERGIVTELSPELLIEARGLSVRIGGRTILDNIDISVTQGEIVTVIGLNGSGKTTLLRALLGLVKVSAGRVAREDGLKVGYAPQTLALDRTMPLTVARFLTLGGNQPRERLQATLDEVGAAQVLDRQVSRLSGGETHRVLLARALMRDPDLLMLDEPMSGVDIAGQAELYDLLVRIRDRLGCGILLVSHDLSLVMSATDSVVCLNRHICCRGRPQAVISDPAFVELFGADVSRTLAVYHHRHDHRHDMANRPTEIVSSEAAPDHVSDGAGHG